MIISPINELTANVLLFFVVSFSLEERREEEELKNKEQDEQLNEYKQPERLPCSHFTESIPIECPNGEQSPFYHSSTFNCTKESNLSVKYKNSSPQNKFSAKFFV